MKTTLLTVVLALGAPTVMLADAQIAVPEFNPAAASSAFAILVGFGFMLRDRFRSR